MTIDFVCHKTLTLTTLKEFLEIFLSSIAKDLAFHFEIVSGLYHNISIDLDYNHLDKIDYQQAKLEMFKMQYGAKSETNNDEVDNNFD